MIRAEVVWNKRNVRDYVLFNMFFKNGKRKILTGFLIACISLIPIAGIISYIIAGHSAILLMVGVSFACIMMYGVVLMAIINGYVKQTVPQDDAATDIAYLDEKGITLYKNTAYLGEVGWDNVVEISCSKKACYIVMKENVLFILEFKNIKEGSVEGLKKLIYSCALKSITGVI